MVRGVQRFREYFRDFTNSFVVVGGVACDEWFTSQGLDFRATKDIDIVLILEPLSAEFVERLWAFVDAGDYEIRERDGGRIYYRFAKPKQADFPAMLELFSRKPDSVTLLEDQLVVPIRTDENIASLSAILMNDVYYELIRNHTRNAEELPVITVDALIPLKARAWLDLAQRRQGREPVDEKDIKKHRNDVFRLAATLPGQPGPELDGGIKGDLRRFLASFRDDSGEWTAIRAALRGLLGGTTPEAAELLDAVRVYFRL